MLYQGRGSARGGPGGRGGGRGGSGQRGGAGGRGGAQGAGRGGAAGGRGGARGGGPAGAERPKKEAILDLAKYVDKRIRVKFTGGREGEIRLRVHPLVLRARTHAFMLCAGFHAGGSESA